MKLLIAIPSQDNMPVPFVESLLRLQRKLIKDGVKFTVNIYTGALVYDSRERLAAKARFEEYTHVLWIDSDMVFDDDIFDKLISHDKDFVTGICHARREPYRSAVFRTLLPEAVRYNRNTYPKSLFKIAGCGFAFCLTSVKLLRDIKQQYGNLFMPSQLFGEDLMFCHKATEMGYELFADPEAKILHIGLRLIGQDDEIIEE